jgi:hypothetical protein
MGRCYVLIDRGLLVVVVFAAGSYAPLLSQAVSCRSRPAAWESGRKVDTNCMGKASRGAAQHKCMRVAVNSTYLPVVLEIAGYAAIQSVLRAAPGLKPIWLSPQTVSF